MIQFLASLVSASFREREKEQANPYPFKRTHTSPLPCARAETMREPDVANLLLIWDLCVKLINSLAPADGRRRRARRRLRELVAI